MKIVSANAARQFSRALGKLYAAPSVEALDRSVARAVKTLFPDVTAAERHVWTSQLCDSPLPLRGDCGATPGQRPFMVELLLTHVQQCRSRLAGGPSVPPLLPIPARPRAKGLTPRELEVLERMALGETDLEISKVLEISSKTVSKHVEHILHKLGVETRTAAVIQTLSPGS